MALKPKTKQPLSALPSDSLEQDHHFMQMALNLARRAASEDEVPVGAILVAPDGQVISAARNQKESLPSPLGHAELIALHSAARKLDRWRLSDLTMYVTLEPCPMCAGALVQARVGRLVYGAKDPKAGAIESLFQITSDPRLNHQIPVQGGVLSEECGQELKKFFQLKRQQKASRKLGGAR